MSDANHQPVDDVLERATEALRGMRVSENPPPHLVAATVEAVNSRFAKSSESLPDILRLKNERRQRMFRIARYSSLAAALLLLAFGLGVVLLWDHGAAPAFGQVIENVKKATSATVTSKQKIGSQPPLEMKFYLEGDFMRMEMPGKQEAFDAKISLLQAVVIDGKTKDIVEVDYANRSARKSKMDEKSAKEFNNPVEELSKLTEKDAELVGDEELNGRKTKVYHLKELHGLFGIVAKVDGKLWVDRESGLPMKLAIETVPDGFHQQKMSITFDDFRWNEHFKDELFKLTIPEGFKVRQERAADSAGGNLEKTPPGPTPSIRGSSSSPKATEPKQ